MQIPTFSIFSATSEIFVTIAVLYCILRTLRGDRLPKVLMGVVLTFELCINVLYMANRAAAADTSVQLTAAMKLFFAAHGTLSLVMFLVLVVTYLLSLHNESDGKSNWFQRHRTGTYVLLVFWMISVVSGEVIFVMRYVQPSLSA